MGLSQALTAALGELSDIHTRVCKGFFSHSARNECSGDRISDSGTIRHPTIQQLPLRARDKIKLETSPSEKCAGEAAAEITDDYVPVGTLRRFLGENEAGAFCSRAQSSFILSRALS